MNQSSVNNGRVTLRAHRGFKSPAVRWGVIAAASVLIVAVLLAALPRLLGTQSLDYAEPQEPGIVNFTDDNGNHIGTFFTRVDRFDGQAPMLVVQVPSEEGYEIDSVSMRFTAQEHMPVSLQASTYDVDYRLTTEGLRSTVFEASELGIYGRGTMDFDFIIGYPETASPVRLSFDVRRHSTSYPYQKQQMSHVVELTTAG